MKKQILLIDMYGVIIKESEGYFIPYTFDRFNKIEHDRLARAFRDERLFTKAGIGDLSSDEFLALLGYSNPAWTMKDYLENYITLDEEFLWFAEKNYIKYDFILLSNDVKEWSEYLFDLYGIRKYFKERIVSGDIHMRKPDKEIFKYVLKLTRRDPDEFIFIDNRVKNLNAAQEIGINTILFNRDNEEYSGNIVNSFSELDDILGNMHIKVK